MLWTISVDSLQWYYYKNPTFSVVLYTIKYVDSLIWNTENDLSFREEIMLQTPDRITELRL